jgi:hypothetical protein
VKQCIGAFFNGGDGSTGERPVELYTLPNRFIRKHHRVFKGWQKVMLPKPDKLRRYRDGNGIEMIAKKLGVPRIRKVALARTPIVAVLDCAEIRIR